MDDVAEKFGRPRAKSLSRHDIFLPAWKEEDALECAATAAALEPPPGALRLEDRRRTVSMSFAEGYRHKRPDRQVNAEINTWFAV